MVQASAKTTKKQIYTLQQKVQQKQPNLYNLYNNTHTTEKTNDVSFNNHPPIKLN